MKKIFCLLILSMFMFSSFVSAASLSLDRPMDSHRQYASAAVSQNYPQTAWTYGESKSTTSSLTEAQPWTKKQWYIFGGVAVVVVAAIVIIASNSGGGGGSSGGGGGGY